jgi:hypothetical protein
MPGRQIMKVLFFESSACGQERETEECPPCVPSTKRDLVDQFRRSRRRWFAKLEPPCRGGDVREMSVPALLCRTALG